MCGIFAIYHPEGCAKFNVTRARELSARQRHRGPDFHGLYQHPGTGNILAHERLAIMDLGCVQPLRGTTEEHQVIHNGEIYNWRFIRDGPLAELCFSTTCDSEAILKLYEKMHDQPEFEHELCLALDGVFAFAVIYGDEFMAARDPIGVKPLYWGTDAGGRKLFSSEMKVIEDSCDDMAAFPPGHFYTPRLGLVRYYEPDWFRWEMATGPADLLALRHCLIAATEKRLMSDAPIGVLLSGGLDSDEEMANASSIFPHNTPVTKEAFFVRKIFHQHFPSDSATQTVLKWVPKWQKNEDPSGRANSMHEQAKAEEAEETKTTTTTMDGHCVGGHPEEDKQEECPEEVGSDLSPTNEVPKGIFGERCQLS
uniref:Glutamine amidotransferase type-2 domain-containing protein n=1 Tax=Globodera pallida TaxID=36090 RepID=A0A183BZS6_GLOPA